MPLLNFETFNNTYYKSKYFYTTTMIAYFNLICDLKLYIISTAWNVNYGYSQVTSHNIQFYV